MVAKALGHSTSRFISGRFAVLMLCVCCLLMPKMACAQDGIDSGIVVALQPGVDAYALAAQFGATVEDIADGGGICSMLPAEGMTDAQLQTLLAGSAQTRSAEGNSAVTDPEVHSVQIHVAFDASGLPGNYAFSGSYSQIGGGSLDDNAGAGQVVAVLDTGVDLQHPALQGHLTAGYNVLNPALPPQDVPDGATNEAAGHGTMVAGIIAKMAPGAAIMPIRVLNGDGNGSVMSVVMGIEYAIHHGATVINLSLGTSTYSDALEDAVEDAYNNGVIVVAADGNDGSMAPHYPAALPNVVAVAAVDSSNVKAAWSNYGQNVCVCAPGVDVRSTFYNGGYATWSGTSFAAPFVSAEAADVLYHNSEMSVDDAVSQICGSAYDISDLNPLYSDYLGEGVIDIQSATEGDN